MRGGRRSIATWAGAAPPGIAAANARFGFPVARTLGNCLSMGNYARLAALIGHARTKEIIFTARLVEAEEARTIGLVSEVLPDHATLMARAEELAKTVAGLAPLTLRATKEALHRLALVEVCDAHDCPARRAAHLQASGGDVEATDTPEQLRLIPVEARP